MLCIVVFVGLHLLDTADRANSDDVVRLDEEMENSVDDAWFLCQRLEKGLTRLNRSGDGTSVGGENKTLEYDVLNKKYRRLKKEYEEKNKELKALKGGK